jgi:hypothetical protein
MLYVQIILTKAQRAPCTFVASLGHGGTDPQVFTYIKSFGENKLMIFTRQISINNFWQGCLCVLGKNLRACKFKGFTWNRTFFCAFCIGWSIPVLLWY